MDSWKQTLLLANSSIREAAQSLERSGLQIVLVVDTQGVLVGTVTDGDIRRGLLRGLDLGSSIDRILHREALVVTDEMNRDWVLTLMKSNRIHQIPVVDSERRVVGLHLWDEGSQIIERPNYFVIMAGGRGSRLGELTRDCPKPLLPVRGKPILEHILERAKNDGFRKFLISIHYLGEQVEAYFGSGERLQVQIDYVKEKTPLGTAGALSLLNPRPELPMVVTNGDVLTNVRYGELLEFHQKNRAMATMATRVYEHQNPFGVVDTRGVQIFDLKEKPVYRCHINAGVYALEPAVLEYMKPSAHCDMTTLFERLRRAGGETIAYPIHEPWVDVGRPEDFKRAEHDEL
jgi:dTDP-glucose pyrophosphorylase